LRKNIISSAIEVKDEATEDESKYSHKRVLENDEQSENMKRSKT